MPRWKRNVFRAVLLLVVPVLVLCFLELVLHITGYGYPIRFFVKMEDGQTLVPNRRFGWQFMRRESSTQPYPLTLAAQKAPGTLRIFVLGESAAQGTPAPAFGFARILEVMLRQQFPDKRFEVVNAAMRGINSHVVLPIARECARLEPDLFLVYMGNNEAIGLHSPDPDGFDMTPYLRLLRAGQSVKATKLAQLTESLLRSVRRDTAKRPEQSMEFFRRARLAADHPRRQAVYDNFRANLDDLCRVTRRSGAKVVVSTVAVNLRDFPPLASLHRAELPSAELAPWQESYARGTDAETCGRTGEALTNFLEAARADDHFAELRFRMARCALATKQTNLMREHFTAACNWDALQFRTDGRMNQIARDTVAAWKDAGLILLDAEQAFAEHAANEAGVPGARFFHEHVHLNFDGDYLLARLFLSKVVQALGLTNAVPSCPLPSRAECAEALGFTEWDEISVTAAMLRMTAKPPFLDQLEHASRQAAAEQALATRSQLFQKERGFQRAVEVYRTAVARRPEDWQIHYNFGSLLNDFGNKPAASAELSTAVRLMPVFLPLRMLLAQTLWDQGKRDDAVWQYREVLRIDPDYPPAKDALAQVGGRRLR